MATPDKPRLRDLGITIGTQPTGPWNAITDVPGIRVGHTTVIHGEGALRLGHGPARTGVTAIHPHEGSAFTSMPPAAIAILNGAGEITGRSQVDEYGVLESPILITNTHAVGMAHHAAVKWMLNRYPETYGVGDPLWLMPVVAETYDGLLNDINGQPVGEADVMAALDNAADGPVAEGNTGGGTGMIAYEFKGGTGTASRQIEIEGRTGTVGVLVQANFGIRDWLTVLGAPIGRHMRENLLFGKAGERGSIIVVIATDLPLLPHQLKRLARRGGLGIGRTGTMGGNGSGDIFLAFSVANARDLPHQAPDFANLEMLNDERIDQVYEAAVQAVEEAVLNAMVAARPMGGTRWDRAHVAAIDHAELVDVLGRYGRLRTE